MSTLRNDLEAQTIEPTLPENVLNGFSFVEAVRHHSEVQLRLVPTHVGHHPFTLPLTTDVLQKPPRHPAAFLSFHVRQP